MLQLLRATPNAGHGPGPRTPYAHCPKFRTALEKAMLKDLAEGNF